MSGTTQKRIHHGAASRGDDKKWSVGIPKAAYDLLGMICDTELRPIGSELTVLIRREAERLGLSLDGKEPSTQQEGEHNG